MEDIKSLTVDSPIGKQNADSGGATVGVVRMDPEESYAGLAELLQDYINNSSEEAWQKIKAKIDYTFENLDQALGTLEAETGFAQEINVRLEKGQKLLFKPNLVSPMNIDPDTHGPDIGHVACTEWPFIAALMRWFHDKLGLSYHRMTLGEAGTVMSAAAVMYSEQSGKKVTTEAAIEGKVGDFYGGWGFYFARKYLAETLEGSASDDPMKGYEESVSGRYIPPGTAQGKLMVYDLNRISDDPTKGRGVEVPEGVNFKTITLHKAIVGGAKDDPEDMKAYPGCILVNVPRYKVHGITLFTNIIKNLGIGLYPMGSSKAGGCKWDYAKPHATIPGIKGGIPHQVWVPEQDPETGMNKRDADGNYIVKKTGGINATMIDVIKAVSAQDIFMIHVVDGIEAINLDHMGIGNISLKQPEGVVFAGLDIVATDLLSARYMFSNVPLKDALGAGLDDGLGGKFPQSVPVPLVEGKNIVSQIGLDCPIARDTCFKGAVKRGLGQTEYYAVGRDVVTDAPIISLQGHLGTIGNGVFSDLITKNLYFDIYKTPWDLQKTCLAYMAASDELTGSSLKNEFLAAFDEDGDGIVTYDDFGKKGAWGPFIHVLGDFIVKMGTDQTPGYLKGYFDMFATFLKCSGAQLNPDGHDLFKEFLYGSACTAALQMSHLDLEAQDPFVTGLTWGRGKWPSFQLASFTALGAALYGAQFPNRATFAGLYSLALRYADLTQNEGRLAGTLRNVPDDEVLNRYAMGQEKFLDFIFYVPEGYDKMGDVQVANVEVTSDPAKILTASFEGGKEVWP